MKLHTADRDTSTVGTRMRVLAAALVALALPQAVIADRHHQGGVRVVTSLRIGNNVEDITYIAAGRHAERVAALNGWDVMAAKVDCDDQDEWTSGGPRPGGSRRAEKPEKLFDVRGLGVGD